MDYMLGTIIPWPASRVPDGWLLCNGRSLPVKDYVALASLLGTTYGGDGKNFNLPNLCGRVPYGAGENPGTKEKFQLGETYSNNKSLSLDLEQMPAHTHTATAAVSSQGSATKITVPTTIPAVKDGSNPTNVPAANTVLTKATTKNGMSSLASNVYSTSAADVHMKGDDISFTLPEPEIKVTVTNASTGGRKAINVAPSYQVLNYIICCEGIFPPFSS